MNVDGSSLFKRVGNVRAALATIAILLTFGVERTATAPRDWYVAPDGVSSNDGSPAHPLDLRTALSGSKALPGDTIWLRGGTYVGNFTSNVTGTASAPITVREYPGEHATIDGRSADQDALVVNGAYAIYWGFEVMNSHPTRTTAAALTIYGSYTKFINMVVHEGGGSGVGFWTPAVGAELYGTIIRNSGIDGADRGYGHSLYTQNQAGVKLIADNIMFNSYSFGIHAYTQGGAVDNFDIEGNILFNHGMASSISGAKSNLLLGGGQVAHNAIIKDNYTYYPQGVGGRGADIGYGVACTNAVVQNNYFVGDTAINLNCSATTVTNNQFFGSLNSNISLALNNTIYTSRPTGVQTYVRPNKYEPGRANIAIYNWSLQSQVDVNLSQVRQSNGDPLLLNGQGFEVRDAENFYGPPVAVGHYNGQSITIPMTGLTAIAPVAGHPFIHTAPEFGAFVLIPTGTSTGLLASFSASPSLKTAGQPSTLSWSVLNATSVTIDQGIGPVNATDSRTITPGSTTIYTLLARDGSGHSLTRTATVEIFVPSPDGAMVPPLLQITDSTGGVWTLSSTGRTLRNGIWMGGGAGSKLLAHADAVYAFGSDSAWWRWDSTQRWVRIGTTQPGAGTGTPTPPTTTPSPDGVTVPPLTQIVDTSGDVWTLTGNGAVLRNGGTVNDAAASKLLWHGGSIYTFGNDSNWWQWTTTWVKIGPTQPGTSPGTIPPPPTTSPDGESIPPLTQLVDSTGAVWTMLSDGSIQRNGVSAAGAVGSKLLWQGWIYALGTDQNWWQWQPASFTWLRIGATLPGDTTPPTTTPPGTPSADGSMIPPLTQLVDATGAVWTLGSTGAILRNGTWAAGGVGTKLLLLGTTVYALGTDNNWWHWLSEGSWLRLGPIQPGTTGGASPDGSTVPPLTELSDAGGATWKLASNGRTLRNDVWVGGGVGSRLLWFGGSIYTLGTDSYWWWQWMPVAGIWSRVGTTMPGH